MCNFAPSNKEGIHLNKGNFLSKKGEYLIDCYITISKIVKY